MKLLNFIFTLLITAPVYAKDNKLHQCSNHGEVKCASPYGPVILKCQNGIWVFRRPHGACPPGTYCVQTPEVKSNRTLAIELATSKYDRLSMAGARTSASGAAKCTSPLNIGTRGDHDGFCEFNGLATFSVRDTRRGYVSSMDTQRELGNG
ncbi:uncharacterized protein K460DRAFT_398203 [Cucurbitaria berberidis CBS 394.84]|uniref:Uncharacterized protein n=1 Tax=Cucurbitaria berberidis CBS 394.84 TaxID=1168544 RepID=A0A9P4GBC8_9PLEO|nr:uncharacterized protein K460DRAFT_398203 [Cucurbitaria berberidis CBS 394.84]KAF1842139.1 hypothetical protein K460DRAFT_398203 [Cucurbitaria berberidis CBS 394.84]